MDALGAISKRASVREFEDKKVSMDVLKKLVDAGRRAPSARAVEPWEFIVITDSDVLYKLGLTAVSGGFISESKACIVVYCKETKYYLEDGCAATENILIAATESGLGACWVAGDKKPYADEISSLLRVPEGYKLISLIPLGWPKVESTQKKKRGVDKVIHWEHF